MKTMKKILVGVGSLCAATAILYGVFTNISFSEVGEAAFSVLQITDVHILNDAKKDKKAFRTIEMMIEEAKPDMIMLTGDLTSEKENFTAFKTFCAFMEEFKIPWGFVFGNHEGLDIAYADGEVLDPDKITDKQTLNDYLESLEYCIYERGEKGVDGMGNYSYIVRDDNKKALMSLIMMDSNSYYPDESIGGYDRFHENQVAWYEKTVKQIALRENGSEEKIVPSLFFCHIPLYEYTEGFDSAKKNGKILSGYRFEGECHAKVDDEMFETMVKLGSTKGVFAGHDHMNDYSVDFRGIRLTYGNSCDHNIYVVPRRGGTLINIKADGSFTTQQLIHHRAAGNIIVKAEK